jgi:hypothetical protein
VQPDRRPIVCWDYDETLGYFRPLEFRFLGEEPPPSMPPPRLRPGIRELIASLEEFTHVVTTAAVREYAKDALHRYGMLELFAAVFGREDGIFPADGKDYGVVGERFGIAEADLSLRLVIVGNDAKRDPDLRYRGLVTIFDDAFLEQPPALTGVVLRRLLAEGEGEFRRGFERLFERADRQGRFGPSLTFAEGVSCGIDYWGSYAEEKLHPMLVRPRPAPPAARPGRDPR